MTTLPTPTPAPEPNILALRDPFADRPEIIAAWFETPEGAVWLEGFLAKRAQEPLREELAKVERSARYA